MTPKKLHQSYSIALLTIAPLSLWSPTSQAQTKVDGATAPATTPTTVSATAQVKDNTIAQSEVIISEFRVAGPGGEEDSYVELFNTTTEPLEVGDWSLRFLDEQQKAVVLTIPAGTSIPSRGHWLCSGRQYSLKARVAPDIILPHRIRSGIQVRDAAGKIVDAVGAHSATPEFREGLGLTDWVFAPHKTQFACVRKMTGGQPQDTNDNARDFNTVSVTALLGSKSVRLGAPAPENLRSPILRPSRQGTTPTPQSDKTKVQPVALTTTQNPPLRNRSLSNPSSGNPSSGNSSPRKPNQAHGTLTLRCRIVNTTGKPLQELYFRVNGITAGPATKGIADVRLLGAAALGNPVPTNAPQGTRVWIAKLDEPPAQLKGGGLNAGAMVKMAPGGLAPGAVGEVRFVLGVETPGRYRVDLSSELFHIVFNGHTERQSAKSDRNRVASNGGRQGASVGAGAIGPQNAARNNAASGGESTPVDQSKLAATLVFEGHTEEGGESAAPRPPSRLKISVFSAEGNSGTLRLRFGGALNATDAADATRYEVLVNGTPTVVENSSYSANSSTVVLSLPLGTLRRGDTVVIKWNNLRDSQNLLSSGQVGPVKVL